MKPKTHTFNGVKYIIDCTPHLGGFTEDGSPAPPNICFVDGVRLEHLDYALHEALHAVGVPDKYLHDSEGYTKTIDIARFLWRLGWRRVYNREP